MEGKTLYCSGFPLDVRDREVRNIFQFQKGFERCRLVASGRVPIAFVTFETPGDALECKQRMQGGRLDEDSSVELRLEIAKRENVVVDESRKRQNMPGNHTDHNKRMKPDSADTTIYFYGLSPSTQEREIEDIVKGIPGFIRHRWSPSKRQGGTPVAYADFCSHDEAAAALNTLNGAAINSVPAGIQVRFADKAAPANRASDRRPLHRDSDRGVSHYSYPPPMPTKPEMYAAYHSHHTHVNTHPQASHSLPGYSTHGEYGLSPFGLPQPHYFDP